jgi:hypothetical protein
LEIRPIRLGARGVIANMAWAGVAHRACVAHRRDLIHVSAQVGAARIHAARSRQSDSSGAGGGDVALPLALSRRLRSSRSRHKPRLAHLNEKVWMGEG